MEIPPIPPPVVNPLISQDVVAKAVPHVQANNPLLASAVAPAPKGEKSNLVDRDKEKQRRRQKAEADSAKTEAEPSEDGQRGGTLNISV